MYQLYHSESRTGMTLNAILLGQITGIGQAGSHQLMSGSSCSQPLLLFIAAQAGFLDGPRVLSNMALDRWFPTRFATLSDRLVAITEFCSWQVPPLCSSGSHTAPWGGWLCFMRLMCSFFTLSQLGMVVHWSKCDDSVPGRKKKLVVNAIGLILTATILVSLSVIKFHDGGWITVIVTSSLISVAFYIKKHYEEVGKKLFQLNSLVESVEANLESQSPISTPCETSDKTAVLFVNGYNGLGLHSLLGIQRQFSQCFQKFRICPNRGSRHW
jgi:hypothetical protein